MQEMQVQSLGQEDPLEEEKATHCSILPWKISWTEEPGGLQSMGSQKSWTHLSTHTHLRSYSYDISEDGDPGCKVIWLRPVEKVL